MLSEQLRQEAQALQETLVEYRRYLHAHPGTGFDLSETLAFVKKELQAMGYEPMACGKAGLVALAGGKKAGKVFLLRGDMDALPIKEESSVPFAATNGNMHACGHDLHAAMLLGAAKLLKAHEAEIQGTVKLMFQPAEEIFEGAHDMIEAGVLQNPTVDSALMIHVMAGMPFAAGTVIIALPGISAPAADYFEIKIQGKGCHGSAPNAGIDPITVAAHIVIALQEIHARELAMGDQAVLTLGTIQAGNAANVIPDTAVMSGSIRTFNEAVRSLLKERLTQIAENIARAFRTEATVTFGSGCPTLVNDEDVANSITQYTKELLGQNNAFSMEDFSRLNGGKSSAKGGGSEDFAYVTQEVPAVMLSLAAGEPKNGYPYPQHHPMVLFDESVLADGSAVYAYAAMRWLEEHGV